MPPRSPLVARVSAALRVEMATRGVTVTALARALGIDRREAQRIHDGERDLGLDELDAIARWLGVEHAVLLHDRPAVERAPDADGPRQAGRPHGAPQQPASPDGSPR